MFLLIFQFDFWLMMYHHSIYWIDKSKTSVIINSGVSQFITPFRFCQQKSMVSIQSSWIFKTQLELLLLLTQRHTTFSTRIFVWRYAKGTTLTLPGQLSQQYDNHKKRSAMAYSEYSKLTSMAIYSFTNQDVSTSFVEKINQNLSLAQKEVLKTAL